MRKKLAFRISQFHILTISLSMLFLFSILLSSCKKQNASQSPPKARVENVQDTLHGVVVNDPYRWLEDWSNPQVQQWSNRENAYARSYLSKLPGRKALRKRIEQIINSSSESYYSLTWQAGKLFAMKFQPPLNQPLLVVMKSADQPQGEKVVVNPNKLDESGSTAIDWYVPSPDGRLVGVSLSKGGSEAGNVHIFETQTGKQFDVVIERVNGGTAGGDLAWLPDGSGFYYTRYPRPGERPEEDLNFYQQVWFHKMGTPAQQDRYVIGKDFPRIAETILQVDPKTGRLLVTVQYGDSGKFMLFLLNKDGSLTKIAGYDDRVVEAAFGTKNDLYLISFKNTPHGKLLRLSSKKPQLKYARTIVPETENVIVSRFYEKSKMAVTPHFIYLTYQLGGPSAIRVFDHNGKRTAGPEMGPMCSIGEITAMDKDCILFRESSYLEPAAWYEFDPRANSTRKTELYQSSPVDFSDAEAVREFAVSKDGTNIPVNIIRPKGIKLDGTNPVVLTGYGGFNASLSPRFNPLLKVWLEQGVVYAIANLRGGGEYGEEWHRAGMLTKKQNVFDDFAAAMQHLFERGYTRSEHLAIRGGSNGGLLMGAMIVQHPELFKVTVSAVGIYDMIRSELTPNGQFNIPEYGTVKNQEQFKALYAYSPYHHVKNGVAYPAVLFTTGANDPRVDPMHSRKMTARLQAATSSDVPILLRTSSTTGHGIGSPLSHRIDEMVDSYSFIFYELGVRYQPVK